MSTTTPNEAVHLDEAGFAQTLRSTRAPVLVDFWAKWCPPCRALAPTIDRLARETRTGSLIAKLDVDEARSVAREHGITSIPTLIIFRNGAEVDRLVGIHPFELIESRLAMAATAGD